MNPNDILAQQQALLNQYMQNAQHVAIGALAVYLALFILGCWVVYMFYARLRGIEQELMKFRIAYEFAHKPEISTRAREYRTSAWPEPPKPLVPAAPLPEEKKYMPKS